MQKKHVKWLRAQVREVGQEATDLYVKTNIGNMKWFDEQVERMGVEKDEMFNAYKAKTAKKIANLEYKMLRIKIIKRQKTK